MGGIPNHYHAAAVPRGRRFHVISGRRHIEILGRGNDLVGGAAIVDEEIQKTPSA